MPVSAMDVDTPVVLIIYNRPDLTVATFDMIRRYRPKYLHVIADGPRGDREGDNDLVEATRAEIKNDWGAKLTLDYSDTNLGCQKRIYSGLSRVFECHDRAIILEDDCLPNLDFFRYCSLLLEHYADEPKVMQITGTNFLSPYCFKHRYALTYHPTPWGWATWRRAWENMDLEMNGFFNDLESMRERLKIRPRAFRKLVRRLEKVRNGDLDSWAYPWMASCIAGGGLVANPCVNLVSNRGFDERSSHTSNANSPLANRPLEPLPEEFSPIDMNEPDVRANRAVFDFFFASGYRKRNWFRRFL